MDKKILLKVFIAILIIAIIIILVLLYFLNQEDVGGNYLGFIDEPEEIEENVEEEVHTELEMVQDKDMFYTVTNCVQTYINYLTDKEAEIVYNLLDSEYKERLNINEQNVLSNLVTYDNYQVFRPKKMYQTDQDQSRTIFLVYGTVRDEIPLREMSITERQETDIYIAVKIDYGENIYTIIPDGYISSENIEYATSVNHLDIEMIEYTNYIDKCEITMKINNNTQNVINIMDIGMNLEYNEDEENSEGTDEDANISEIINEEEQIINGKEEKEIKVIFRNNFKTPKQITIYDEENNEEIVIPINNN